MDTIAPGRYIVAVSGGVDSMVLLDMLCRVPDIEVVVAHVDHGIRPESSRDAEFVAACAKKYHVRYIKKSLALGKEASEALARNLRYEFLQQCRKKEQAIAIITAHHQDDLIETAILAIMRGTGWRGLAPFMARPDISRPLLQLTKDQLIAYARGHNLSWREDSTNYDESYTRNYIRHTLIPRLNQVSSTWYDTLLQQIRKQCDIRAEIAQALDAMRLRERLPRYQLIMLPPEISYEVLQHTCKMIMGNTLERPLARAALLFAKVAKPGKVLELSRFWQLRAESANVVVEPRRPVVSLKEH